MSNRLERQNVLKVADSNVLQTDILAEFLARPHHRVVLPDYVSMEAYKGDTLKSIQQSMRVLARRPRQVIVLKGTEEVCGLKGRASGLHRRMIDINQTRSFPEYCRNLKEAERGDTALIDRLLHLGRSATSNIERVKNDAAGLIDIFHGIQGTYTNDDIRRLRKGERFTEEFLLRLRDNTLRTAVIMFRDHPKVNKIPQSAIEARNTLIFRFAICVQFLILEWISAGSQPVVKPVRLANDNVDMMIAAYATFFDGLITNDNKLIRIFELTSAALKGLYAAPVDPRP